MKQNYSPWFWKRGFKDPLFNEKKTEKLFAKVVLSLNWDSIQNKTPAKHRDIFLPFHLHHVSHSYFGRGIGSK